MRIHSHVDLVSPSMCIDWRAVIRELWPTSSVHGSSCKTIGRHKYNKPEVKLFILIQCVLNKKTTFYQMQRVSTRYRDNVLGWTSNRRSISRAAGCLEDPNEAFLEAGDDVAVACEGGGYGCGGRALAPKGDGDGERGRCHVCIYGLFCVSGGECKRKKSMVGTTWIIISHISIL